MHRELLLFLLVLSPLLLGGNRQVFWAIDGWLASITLVGFAISTIRDSGVSVTQRRAIVSAAAVILAVAAWMTVQASGLTPQSYHHPIWLLVAFMGTHGAMSINPSHTMSAIGFWAALAIGLVAIGEARHTSFVERVLKVSALTALAIALFGIAAMVSGAQTLGLAGKDTYLSQLTGTFANPNSAATYFCFGMIAALTLAATTTRSIWLAIAISLFAAVVLTGSRAGLISANVGIVVFYALWSSGGSRFSVRFILAAVILAAIVVAAWMSGVGFFGRTDMQASTDVRLSLYREAAAAIGERPVLGHGAGTFGDVEPLFHRDGTPRDRVWTRAHSTYLEAAADLGIPVALAVLGFLFLLLAFLIRAFRAGIRSPALLAAVSASAVVMVHSAVDFSLQIQAVAILYAVLLGLGVGKTAADWDLRRASACDDKAACDRSSARPSAVRSQPWIAGPALMLALSCVSIAASSRIALVELAVPPSLWLLELRPFRAVRSDPPVTRSVREFAVTLINDPYLLYSRAPECRLVELRRAPAPSASLSESARCLSVIDAALRVSPSASELWLSRAEMLAQRPGSESEFLIALSNSYRTGASEGYLSPARLTLALSNWASVSPDVRQKASEEIRHSSEAALTAIAELLILDLGHRDNIRSVVRAIGDENLHIAFSETLRRQSDLGRREADLIHAGAFAEDCSTDCSSEIEIVAAADTYLGPANFRLWVDGRLMGETSVAVRRDVGSGNPLSPGQRTIIKMPDRSPRRSIEIEFVNDVVGPREELDRNLEIRKVAVNGRLVPLLLFRAPLGSEGAISITREGIRFDSNGTARYEIKDAGGNSF